VDHFSQYFNKAPVLYLEGRQFPIKVSTHSLTSPVEVLCGKLSYNKFTGILLYYLKKLSDKKSYPAV